MGSGYGVYLDSTGRLTGLTTSDTGSYDVNDATFLGTVPMNPDGSPDVTALASALFPVQTSLEDVLAVSLLSYDRFVAIRKKAMIRCMSATQAMALQHAVHRLPAGCDLKAMVLNCTSHSVEVGLFDYGDDVVEDLALCAGRLGHSGVAGSVRELVLQAFRDAGISMPPAPPFLVIMASEDAGAFAVFEGVLQELFGREVAVVRKDSHDIAVGAADLAAIRLGKSYMRGFLELSATPYAFEVAIDETDELVIARNTTIPTQKMMTYELGTGRDVRIRVGSPYLGEAALTYFVPSESLYEIGATSDESTVELTIDVDCDNVARLILKGPNGKVWKERLDNLPRARGGSRTAGSPSVRETQPMAQPHARPKPQPNTSDVPAELMRLIGLLDEVDLGMKNVSSDALKTPAGQVASTLQARLLDLIAEVGGTYYQALGQTFDPHVHEAAAIIDNPVFPANYVVEEIKRGFRYHGKIVRYSVVRVANPR